MKRAPPEIVVSSILMAFSGLFFIGLGISFLKEMMNRTHVLAISAASMIFGFILVLLPIFLWMGHDEARMSAILIHALILIFSPIPFLYSIPLMWRTGRVAGLFASLSLTLPAAYSLIILYLLTRPRAASYMRKVRAPPLV